MLERLIKWFSNTDVGPLGKIFFLGIISASVGISLFEGPGAGFLMFGGGVVIYCLFRGIDSVE